MEFSILCATIFVVQVLRTALYPLVVLGRFFIPVVRRRWLFEGRVLYAKTVNFDYGFAVSSEGEFEQILPLVTTLLNANARIQIVYSSPSLEKKITNFHHRHYRLLAVYPLPLLRAFPWGRPLSFLQGKYFFVCRYDFYPEIVRYLLRGSATNVLLSGTLKGKQDLLQKGAGYLYLLYRDIYALFDIIVPATNADGGRFTQFLATVSPKILPAMDFRIVQIMQRLELFAQNPKYPGQVIQALANFSGKKIIIGSAWPAEMDLLGNPHVRSHLLAQDYLLMVAPHRLDENSVAQLEKLIAQQISSPITLYVVRDDQITTAQWKERFQQGPAILLLLIPGILCEIYRCFDLAIVGGGLGKSVHSLLEPFLAGALIACGPKVHRSTEFDLISEIAPTNIRILDDYRKVNLEEFWHVKKQPLEIDQFGQQMQGRLHEFLAQILKKEN